MKINDNCSSCGQCAEACLCGAITFKARCGQGYAVAAIDKDLCVECGKCAEICPADAITD
ncbi:MAG TPA: 4Fe-4S binding protein [Spirochaetota bacterium]|nr:4Fe-4S binding protein [Spirochaetota bacterium]